MEEPSFARRWRSLITTVSLAAVGVYMLQRDRKRRSVGLTRRSLVEVVAETLVALRVPAARTVAGFLLDHRTTGAALVVAAAWALFKYQQLVGRTLVSICFCIYVSASCRASTLSIWVACTPTFKFDHSRALPIYHCRGGYYEATTQILLTH